MAINVQCILTRCNKCNTTNFARRKSAINLW